MDVGKKCQFAECKQQDFLPFKCADCQKSFCMNHRQPSDHKCEAAPVKNQPQAQAEQKPKLKCANKDCKTQLNLVNAYDCKICEKKVCVKHRFQDAHECKQLDSAGIVLQNKQSANAGAKKEESAKSGCSSWFSCFKSAKQKNGVQKAIETK